MDITFIEKDHRFNYRVCAIILHEDRILTMKDERSPYYYLPGGRVALGETAEKAILREVREELRIDGKIVRPLWLNQAFFTEDVDHSDFHELCICFLIDVSETDLLERGSKFTLKEGDRTHRFEWITFGALQKEYFYPIFLKKEIFNLPDSFTLRTEIE